MSILIVAPTMKTDSWKGELIRIAPDLDVRIWPETGDADRVEYVLCWNHPHGEFKKFRNLKCIASMGAGVDRILEDADLPEVPISRIVDPSMAQSMTEFVVLAVLNWIRQTDSYRRDQREKQWRQRIPLSAGSIRVGILGLGQLGGHAARAFASLGFRASGWSRTAKVIPGVDTYTGEEGFFPFLSGTRALVCLLPLTPHTRGILNRETFEGLEDGAYLVNTARGEHLVEEDLLEALGNGKLSGACLDVFRTEPLPENHPFWDHPKIKVFPHISSLTNPKAVCSQIVDNYRRMKAGRPLRNLVNKARGY